MKNNNDFRKFYGFQGKGKWFMQSQINGLIIYGDCTLLREEDMLGYIDWYNWYFPSTGRGIQLPIYSILNDAKKLIWIDDK